MSRHPLALTVLLLTATATMTAYARAPSPRNQASIPTVATRMPALARVVVHKSRNCGCCAVWVEHLRKAGFTIDVRNEDNLNPVKERLGVPAGKGSCHTAEVAGYFVEGHVPAQDIQHLLAEKPDIKGLVLSGMPSGSPGMDMPHGATQPYTVEQVGRDGTTTAFAQHGQ